MLAACRVRREERERESARECEDKEEKRSLLEVEVGDVVIN